MKALLIFVHAFLCVSLFAQDIKCSYVFEYKISKKQTNYKTDYALCLESDGTKVLCYSENELLRDSLGYALTDQGEDMYYVREQKDRYPKGVQWSVKGDFSEKTFVEYDYSILHCFVANGEYILPEWEIGDEMEEVCGFLCRKASATYYGRNWTVWYTEEIPMSIGPWLLWGTPGLILKAEDGESLFRFTCETIGQANDERKSLLESIISRRFNIGAPTKVHEGSLKEIEIIRSKINRNPKLAFEMVGMRVMSYDRDGKLLPEKTKYPYIPLIADSYWE